MKIGLKTVLLVAAAVLLVLPRVDGPVAAQTADGQVARSWDGKPDLNGIWQAMNTANWDLQDHPARAGLNVLGVMSATPPGLGVVVGGEIPYQKSALAKKQQNFEKR